MDDREMQTTMYLIDAQIIFADYGADDGASRVSRENEKGKPMIDEKRIMPVFVFGRRSDIERETGMILAGQLIVDIPKTEKPKRHQQRMIAEIVARITAAARSGQMPDNAVAYGWPGGCRPANAVDVHDDALMAAWIKDRMVLSVRIDPRHDDYLRIDSDMLLQMGLLKRH